MESSLFLPSYMDLQSVADPTALIQLTQAVLQSPVTEQGVACEHGPESDNLSIASCPAAETEQPHAKALCNCTFGVVTNDEQFVVFVHVNSEHC